jgi:type II secretion system protein H
LIELMVVMVLIGILSAVIIPEMKGSFGDALLRSTARDLVTVFTYTSSRAVSLNQVHRVRFDQAGHFHVDQPPRRGSAKAASVAPRDIPSGEGTLDSRISIRIRRPGDEEVERTEEPEARSGPAEPDQPRERRSEEGILFYPDGTADPAEVVLRDPSGFGLALRINPVTAHVQVIELERE